MPAFKLEQFGGMLPAWSDKLLPAGQAADAVNAELFSGELRGWRQPKILRTLVNSAAKFVFRVPTISTSTSVGKLTFLGNVTPGSQLELGEEVYTFVTGSVTKAYDVLIAGTGLLTAENLLNAIVAGAGSGTNYGANTIANPAVTTVAGDNYIDNYGADPFIVLKAPDVGAAYNNTHFISHDANAVVTAFTGGANEGFDATITGASAWLEFADEDTDVLRSPVVDDSFRRYYFASPSQPPKYNTYDRIQAGQDPWLLGLPPPGCAPTVEPVGGGDLQQVGSLLALDGVSTFPIVANQVYLFPFTPNGAMELDQISFVPSTSSTTGEFLAVLFDDVSGAPHELLNVGDGVLGWTANVSGIDTFSNPTPLLRGVTYWLGFMFSETVYIYTGSGSNTGSTFMQPFSNGAPSFAGTVSSGVPALQVWGDLTTSSVLSARTYVYTWLSEYLEESPPSPPTIANGWSNATWNIGLWTPPADDMGVVRNIKKLRIYRTISAVSGQTDYFWVADVDVGTVSYADSIDDSVVALNTLLPSTTWFPPPPGLVGMQVMPNGIFVGFKGNELWFSEPYRPHAWPPGYVITTEFPIVGIGVTGQAVVAATSSTPYVAQGVNPQSMALNKLQSIEPCTSRGSVIGNDQGVFFTSPNGLIKVTQAGQSENITESWITRERWRALTPQTGVHAVPLHGTYFAYSVTEQVGFYVDLSPYDAQSFTIWPQPGGHRIGFSKLTKPNDTNIDHIEIDPWSGVATTVQNGAVYYYDFQDQSPVRMAYKWRSKQYQQTTKKNFEAMKIFFDVPSGTPTQNVTRVTTDTQPTYPSVAGQYGIVRVYADGVLVTTREIRTSGEMTRILSGFKADTWQWEFEGIVNISNLQAGTSVKELSQV